MREGKTVICQSPGSQYLGPGNIINMCWCLTQAFLDKWDWMKSISFWNVINRKMKIQLSDFRGGCQHYREQRKCLRSTDVEVNPAGDKLLQADWGVRTIYPHFFWWKKSLMHIFPSSSADTNYWNPFQKKVRTDFTVKLSPLEICQNLFCDARMSSANCKLILEYHLKCWHLSLFKFTPHLTPNNRLLTTGHKVLEECFI